MGKFLKLPKSFRVSRISGNIDMGKLFGQKNMENV